MIVLRLGGGRQSTGSPVNPSVGISEIRPVGESTDSSNPLAVIHAASEADWERAATAYLEAVRIGAKPNGSGPVILERVAREGVGQLPAGGEHKHE
jgi:thymidine phosphorylase